MSLVYTTIQHRFRKLHQLTNNEYVLCDLVAMLTRAPGSKVPGWCYMSREKLADELDLSKQSVITLIAKMECAGFITVHPVTKYLQPTDKWLAVYFTDGKESLPPLPKNANFGKESLPEVKKVDEGGKESLPLNGKESLPYNIQVNNVLDNNNTAATPPVVGNEGTLFPKDLPKEPKEKSSAKKEKVIVWPWADQRIQDAWQRWKEYKREQHRFTYKSIDSENTGLKQLFNDTGGNLDTAIYWIDYSIGKTWQGIFQPKEPQKNGSTTKQPQQALSRNQQQGSLIQELLDDAAAGFAELYAGAPND